MTEPSTGRRRLRLVSTLLMLAFLCLPIAGIAYLMTGDRTGDPGMTNVFSAMLVLVAVFIALLWFAFAAPLRRRTRLLPGTKSSERSLWTSWPRR